MFGVDPDIPDIAKYFFRQLRTPDSPTYVVAFCCQFFITYFFTIHFITGLRYIGILVADFFNFINDCYHHHTEFCGHKLNKPFVPLKGHDWYMYSILSLKSYASCPHITFMCFAWSVQLTANISLKQLVGICNEEVCFLWRRHWNLKYYSDQHIRSFLAREPLRTAIIISAINGVREDNPHFNYYSRRKQCQNEVFIRLTTTYALIQCSYFTTHAAQTFEERTEDLVPGYPTAEDIQKGTVHRRAKRSGPNTVTNPKPEGTKTTINVNEGATNTKCFKRTALSNVTCISVLKLTVKDR